MYRRLAVASLTTACLGTSALLAAADLPTERILYTTRRPTNWQIHLLQPGAPTRRLTDDAALSYDAAFSPDGRWLVFCSERSGSPQLWALALAQNAVATPLTQGPFLHAAPAFAPDGKELYFVSDREGNADIYRMPFRPGRPPSDGDAVHVTRNVAGDFRPAVSPDGRTVAFSSDRDFPREPPFRAEIYAMNRDGTQPRRLTRSGAMSGSPVWSADGRTIFFYSNRDGAFRIWAMRADGTHPRAVTPKGVYALSPAVLADGRIAFTSKSDDGFRVLSVPADGSKIRLESGSQDCRAPAADRAGRIACTGPVPAVTRPFLDPGTHVEVRLPDRVLDVQAVHALFCSIGPGGREIVTGQWLTTEESGDMHLVASRPDGSGERELFRPAEKTWVWGTSWARQADVIAFTVGPIFAPEAVVDIWTVHGDGSGARNLTDGRFRNNAFPDSTPDGRQIVFRSNRDGDKSVYLMDSDGTNVRRITSGDGVQSMPSISPAGDLVVFSTFQLQLQSLVAGRPAGPPRVFDRFFPSVHPRFSPDGKWIVYASRRGWLSDEAPLSSDESQPYGEIFVAPVEGGEPIRLTHDRWEDSVPCWGPMPLPEAGAASR